MSRILIIEDEIDQAELYRLALEGAGHEVVAVADGIPARASAMTPEVIILDERLGRRSGSALIPTLRLFWPGVRILVLTADPDVAENAVQKGADQGRIKPLALSELVLSVQQLAGPRRGS